MISKISKNLLKYIEENYKKNSRLDEDIKIGDILSISYKIIEGTKEKIQSYEGILMSKNNKGLGKSLTIRRVVQGIGVEQVFSLNSPNILTIKRRESLKKIRRSKLYFLRK